MGLIVAYKKDDTVYIGTDSSMFRKSKERATCESNYRVHKLDNGIIIGIVTTNVRVEQLLYAYSDDIFTLDRKGNLTRKHLVQRIIPEVLACLEENELLDKNEGGFYSWNGILLVFYKDKIFEVSEQFQIYTVGDYVADGDGYDFTMSTLSKIKDSDDVNQKLVDAMSIASKYNKSVLAPYVLIDTKTLEYHEEVR